MGSVSFFNDGLKHLICVTGILTKCAWVRLLKRKKVKTGLHGFIEKVKESKHRPNR